MFEFSPYAYEFHEDPYPTYRRLREEAPVYHNDKLDFWAISRHADVMAAFKDPKRFSNSHGVSIDPLARGPRARAGTSFLAMDPPEHTRFRSIVARSFTPRRVAALEPRIRELTAARLDELVGSGGFDAIKDFSGKLPMDVISEMLGVPAADRDALRGWADQLVHREEGVFDVPPEAIVSFGKMRSYFVELIARLRREPGDDLLSSLVAMGESGQGLSDDDLYSFCNLMVVAGNETTTKLLGNALYWLWRNPEQRALLQADLTQIPASIEETLRYDNSTQALMRVMLEDVEIAGSTIPAGDHVLLLVGSANRDPDVFARPDDFTIGRDTTEMLSFGRGTHFCMGAALARLEARVAFEEWWKRFPDYEVRAESVVRVHSVNVRGFASLPVTV
ncbi:MAG: cytochrome P450 [Myxococcales bacterium]|nr:cytochrome P450 [Myxococcales bacterium]HIK86060.1 cytochrome P450 [Myxococcales bacterium]